MNLETVQRTDSLRNLAHLQDLIKFHFMLELVIETR